MWNWLINNWELIVTLLFIIVYFVAIPSRVTEWLVYAVSMAEKDLGSGTGQLKLRQVYDMFIGRYPILSQFVPFTLFSNWVDKALKEMKKQLEQNKKLKDVIENK